MLAKFVAAVTSLFILLGFALCCALLVGMIGQWYALQNEAQYLAVSQGKYGGYTTEADEGLRDFIRERNLDPARLTVEVSAPNAPVPWGTTVWARLTYRFRFGAGNFLAPFEVTLTATGRAVSTYLPGAYDVVYTSP